MVVVDETNLAPVTGVFPARRFPSPESRNFRHRLRRRRCPPPPPPCPPSACSRPSPGAPRLPPPLSAAAATPRPRTRSRSRSRSRTRSARQGAYSRDALANLRHRRSSRPRTCCKLTCRRARATWVSSRTTCRPSSRSARVSLRSLSLPARLPRSSSVRADAPIPLVLSSDRLQQRRAALRPYTRTTSSPSTSSRLPRSRTSPLRSVHIPFTCLDLSLNSCIIGCPCQPRRGAEDARWQRLGSRQGRGER
jgi:hypothetical protein